MSFSKVLIIIALCCKLSFASAPITSFLFFVPSIKVEYAFGKNPSLGIGLNGGVYHLYGWMTTGIVLGADYNIQEKLFGFSQALAVGTPYFGIKGGGYFSNLHYLPKVGCYAGYFFGYLEYDFTFYKNESKLGLSADFPFLITGLTIF